MSDEQLDCAGVTALNTTTLQHLNRLMAEVVVVHESIESILWLLYSASVPGSYSLPAPRRRLDVAAHESEGSAFLELFPAGPKQF